MWNCLSCGAGKLLYSKSGSFKISTDHNIDCNKEYKTYDSMTHVQVTEESVSNYLKTNKQFLDKFILEELDLDHLERLIIRKSRRQNQTSTDGRQTNLSNWKFCVHADKRKMLEELTRNLQTKPSKNVVLWEIAKCICSAVAADGFRLYIPMQGEINNLGLYIGSEEYDTGKGDTQLKSLEANNSVPCHVSTSLTTIRTSKTNLEGKFSHGFSFNDEASHILCQPVMQANGELAAVLELWRKEENGQFFEEDEEIASSYLVWGGVALHYDQLYLTMSQQRTLNDFLLAVVKSIFQDMVSMDALVMKIMNFAQRLVDADRASLFLVDNKSHELYATIFDVGLENIQDEITANEFEYLVKIHTSNKEIRFPLGTGIAGQVAMTGEILNIKDAYADKRFNRTVDQLTGYQTKTILCMPIFIRSSIIGVVQMVNKHSGFFTKEDEQAFEMFAVYCGLALHHAKLYDKIRKSEQKYRVALEVLSYHNTCTEEEFQYALRDGVPEKVIGVDNYYFNHFDLQDFEMVKYAIYMFTDLFGLSKFDKSNLLRFTLTVRKNYRRVPYHNWNHGFSVANCMYSIIKHSQGTFTPNESLALYIGALCHDLDHRGKNNKFMLETESPLAIIYSTSTMEHHHFNQTVTILQQEGHNIFNKLTDTEYKEVLSTVKHCILATDLALFFPNKEKLTQIIQEGSFSWKNEEHRRLIQAIGMTSSDLAASAKPWNVQVKTVEIIFEEFYQQGDAERAAGRTPIAMMDRNQPDQQAASQVGFLTGICIPCYRLLYSLIPETKPLLDMCEENLRLWQNIDKEMKKKVKNK